jgi:hypothetical protein
MSQIIFPNELYLLIALLSTFSYVYDYEMIKTLYIIGSFSLLDIIFTEKPKDLVLHHVFVLCISKYTYNQLEISHGITMIIYTGLGCEISSIFLALKEIIRSYSYTRFHTLNDMLFLLTFFYFRVYKYGYTLLTCEDVQNVLTNGTPNDLIKINIGVYGLFLLNLYWGRIIVLKIMKKIQKTYFNLDKICIT